MEIYFVDDREQNEDTVNPQLFNGEVKYWKTSRRTCRFRTLSEHINYYKEFRPYVKEIYSYDIEGRCKIRCTQNCKVGTKTGCYVPLTNDIHNPKNYSIYIDSFEVFDEEIRKEYYGKINLVTKLQNK